MVKSKLVQLQRRRATRDATKVALLAYPDAYMRERDMVRRKYNQDINTPVYILTYEAKVPDSLPLAGTQS